MSLLNSHAIVNKASILKYGAATKVEKQKSGVRSQESGVRSQNVSYYLNGGVAAQSL
ncbi:hypothetical protein [uncultured Candidatus Kuenenia sp.]|uniref:hypothetical protein n=1 Tax=uncultured Candidatus Kuenenia sp. TaxID=1048336 RepID=UPI0025E1FC27|nr:hypothetical protein [uncultured Candidatus Kuenenia sp.]